MCRTNVFGISEISKGLFKWSEQSIVRKVAPLKLLDSKSFVVSLFLLLCAALGSDCEPIQFERSAGIHDPHLYAGLSCASCRPLKGAIPIIAT